tara:strand:+ start:166 stop:492 length:327 start_codon:yes stop_codon:yes gene_type:complete
MRAENTAASRAYRTPQRFSAGVIGNIRTRTPKKPTKTDTKRFKPTCSPAITTEKPVIKIGMVWVSAVARLISMLVIAKNHVVSPKKPNPVLNARPGILVILRNLGPLE